jgi:hypothetical protein
MNTSIMYTGTILHQGLDQLQFHYQHPRVDVISSALTIVRRQYKLVMAHHEVSRDWAYPVTSHYELSRDWA